MFYFDCEVYVIGGVDDVDLVFVLEVGYGGRCDCDVVFFFLFYLVGG